jgi:hypothetical protein
VAPEHWVVLVAEHWPHAPEGSQAGVVPWQSTSPAQARQACVVVLHTGTVPLHCVSVRQATHVPAPVSQTGVAPEHCVTLVVEH